jgi:ornithine cyclodeaminase/alanine dehydrogenase-like protein (mu-crystallin family)
MALSLADADIAKFLTYDLLIPAMEQALAAFSNGQVIQPVRNVITIEEGKRFLGVMPAVAQAAMGAKLVCFYPANAGTPHPTHTALIVLFDPETGEPLATMDGRLITEMRTAAVSAAVTKQLAPESSKILAILGSGVQAQSHVEALRSILVFDEVRVWSPNTAHAEAFASAHHAVALDAEAAVKGADVVVVATSATEPVLKGQWLKPGAHVNSVGAPRPTWRELDDDVMKNLIIVDSREAALKESGDIILSQAKIFAEAGEIFSGIKKADRQQTTIFKSLGLAVEDIATAKLVYDLAMTKQK